MLQTVVNTWEQPCDLCGGNGSVRTHKSGRKKKKTTLATCLKCSGLGMSQKYICTRKKYTKREKKRGKERKREKKREKE
jgi:DnaJ-class molecular chaperone